MTTPGRGRGYTGRHHLREPRPGDGELTEELEAARTLAELSPRSTDPAREPKDKWEMENHDKPVDGRESSGADEAVLKELLFIDEQYKPLLVLLEQFSPGEDGIQFNRKLRHFETTVTNMCPDENRLQPAFAAFRAAALQSSVTARKLAAVGASFTRQQRQQSLRAALLNVVMQGTFTKLDILERANPQYLINATNLMGDYFAEARLCNGNKVHILAFPLLQYIKSLLASDDIRAHRSLATQLMQNGRELLTVLSQELEDLSISIRLRILSPPPVSIIWLLLSADLCLNKFLPLPNTLQQFYASHLELTSDEHYNEVSYGSWKKSEEKNEAENSEMVSQNLSQISLNNSDDKPKLRPILGAGAGLLRQEQSFSSIQDNYDMWTTKGGLTKRYDLNSWRQTEEEKKEETEPVFNPTLLPPNYTAPYNQFNYQDNYANYLQQGDGTYIQDFSNINEFQYEPQTEITSNTSQINERSVEQPVLPEKVNNEVQKSSRRPIENWRKEKSDLKEDPNRNRQRNWTRQRSKDSVNEDEYESKDKLKSSKERLSNRLNRRNSGESIDSGKAPPKRNVTDVPRNHKYWDHDDRCDKDYNS